MKIDKEITRIKVIKKNFILGMLFYYLANEDWDNEEVDIAAVSPAEGKKFNLRVNTKNIEKMDFDADQVQFVAAHELGHLFLMHFARLEGFKRIFSKYNKEFDMRIVNIAVDYAVNGALHNFFGFTFPKNFDYITLNDLVKNTPADSNVGAGKTHKITLFFDPDLNKTAEEILEILLTKLPVNNEGDSNNNNPDGDNSDGDCKSGKGNNKNRNRKGSPLDNVSDKIKEHSFTNDKETIEKMGNIVKEIISQAKTAGVNPGNYEEYITKLVSKKDWKLALIYELKSGISSITYPNKRYFGISKKFIMPRFKHNNIAEVNIVLDVSGSISDKEISYFLGEAWKLVSKHFKINIITHDAEITGIYKNIKEQDLNKFKVTGRGGTDFRPVIKYIKQNKLKNVIWFTDCCGNWGEENPDTNVIVMRTCKEYSPKIKCKVIDYEVV